MAELTVVHFGKGFEFIARITGLPQLCQPRPRGRLCRGSRSSVAGREA